jgi:hypothetical protein
VIAIAALAFGGVAGGRDVNRRRTDRRQQTDTPRGGRASGGLGSIVARLHDNRGQGRQGPKRAEEGRKRCPILSFNARRCPQTGGKRHNKGTTAEKFPTRWRGVWALLRRNQTLNHSVNIPPSGVTAGVTSLARAARTPVPSSTRR